MRQGVKGFSLESFPFLQDEQLWIVCRIENPHTNETYFQIYLKIDITANSKKRKTWLRLYLDPVILKCRSRDNIWWVVGVDNTYLMIKKQYINKKIMLKVKIAKENQLTPYWFEKLIGIAATYSISPFISSLWGITTFPFDSSNP